MSPSKFQEHLDEVVSKLDQLLSKAISLDLCDVPDIGLIDCVNRMNHFIIAAAIDIAGEVANDPKIMAEINNWECKREEVA